MTPEENNEHKTTRRGFLELTLGWTTAAAAVAASSAAAVRFLVPNVLYEPSAQFKAGKPGDYADGSITFLEAERCFLLRKGNTFRCMSAVCTHLGCTINETKTGYHCPCHGSVFNEDGKVVGGPAPRPLPWFLVSLSPDGRLMIDKNQLVPADKYLVI
ncbi:cytochrome b6-f complex iron-sulfur subunit [mine drainage metagenome]|uniref:Cytochrome b6-f complex iron-sulfur subunit n=1 Tax=mine drainage metagenome TaxID=410659 RepID=A0A1J5TRR7_9ZZZZ